MSSHVKQRLHVHTCIIHTYIHTFILHTFMHSYIHSYFIHSYIHYSSLDPSSLSSFRLFPSSLQILSASLEGQTQLDCARLAVEILKMEDPRTTTTVTTATTTVAKKLRTRKEIFFNKHGLRKNGSQLNGSDIEIPQGASLHKSDYTEGPKSDTSISVPKLQR